MKDIWIVRWTADIFGSEDEYDSFEEAKAAFRRKITRDIEAKDWLLLLDGGEQRAIAEYLCAFFENTNDEDDPLLLKYDDDDIIADFREDGFDFRENDDRRLDHYPSISANFAAMDDPDKRYVFDYIYYYHPDIIDFDGYEYKISLQKVKERRP